MTEAKSPDPRDLGALRERMRGALITPGDDAYETRRRVWNGMIDKRPALIAECSGTADVIAVLGYARESRLPIAVRGGGHNVGGAAIAEGGVVIDLARMNGVRVDPATKTARVGGGATLGAVDHEAQAFGLAVPAGLVSKTGVGGLTLHGGLGFLTRRFGLTCDSLIGADVVTADGAFVHASETDNADLLWALRGGGGNFGVVTGFEFQLHPVGPEVWVAMVMFPAADATRLLAFFRDFMAAAPDELSALAVLWNTPHDPSIPEAVRNQPTIAFAACWSGPVEAGEAAVKPLREAGTPLIDFSGRMPFTAAQQLFDPDYPDGRRYYWKSIYLGDLAEGTIASLAALGASRPSPLSSLDIWALGGALARVPASHAAFATRRAPYLLGIEANWDDPRTDDANIAWARGAHAEMAKRFPDAATYLNFPGFGEEGEAMLERAFAEHLDRLRSVKAKYDPDNVFRSSVSIAPRRR